MFFKEFKLIKSNDPKVAYPKALKRLKAQGRCRSNIRALELQDREIIPARRLDPRKDPSRLKKHRKNLVWCMLCQTAVSKKALRESHLKTCARGKELKLSKADTQKLARHAESLIEPEAVIIERLLEKEELAFKEVLYPLTKDRLAIVKFVVEDEVAHALLSTMASNGRNKANWMQQARMRLRLGFQILMFYRAALGIDNLTLKESVSYQTWHYAENGEKPLIIRACLAVSGYNPDTHTFERPTDVMNTSSFNQVLGDIVLHHLHHSEEDRDAICKDADILMKFSASPAWKNFTVRPAARQKAAQINFRSILVPSEDSTYYLKHLEKKADAAIENMVAAYKKKDRNVCRRAHSAVVEALPAAIGTYCYRRLTEPYQLTLHDYNRRPDLNDQTESYDHMMGESEKEEVKKVFTVEHRTKGDRPVISLIKVKYMAHLDLLCSPDFRKFIGLPMENKYVFGSTRSRDSLGHANPSKCQVQFALECEKYVKNHLNLRSRHLRMTFATNMVQMDLTYQTKKDMCAMMGHSIDVHEKFYNKPQHLRLAATMGYALRAAEENRLKDLQQKSIEDQLKLTPAERAQQEKDDSL